jgi:hypothetical protein
LIQQIRDHEAIVTENVAIQTCPSYCTTGGGPAKSPAIDAYTNLLFMGEDRYGIDWIKEENKKSLYDILWFFPLLVRQIYVLQI